jgi:hypothetical protein
METEATQQVEVAIIGAGKSIKSQLWPDQSLANFPERLVWTSRGQNVSPTTTINKVDYY